MDKRHLILYCTSSRCRRSTKHDRTREGTLVCRECGAAKERKRKQRKSEDT